MDCCRKTGNHGRWNCSLRCEMSCICFVLSILYKDRIFLFCTCILSYLQRCICAVSVLYLCWNCRLRWGMTQALPLIDALTTLGWRLTSVGPPALQLKMIHHFGQISNETLLHDGVAKKWGSILICFVFIFNRGNGGELSQELGKCLKNSFGRGMRI